MKFSEFKKDGSTLAVRTINRYADEVGKDSMDYDMFKKSAELLDKQMLKSLAQHIENSAARGLRREQRRRAQPGGALRGVRGRGEPRVRDLRLDADHPAV